MAASEEGIEELKSLVAQTFETKGILNKFKAQLRACVYTTLDEHHRSSGVYLENTTEAAKQLKSSTEGRLCLDLVREFLEYCGFEFTLSVFLPEANLTEDKNSRESLAEKLKLSTNTPNPLLLEAIGTLLKGSGNVGGLSLPNGASRGGTANPQTLHSPTSISPPRSPTSLSPRAAVMPGESRDPFSRFHKNIQPASSSVNHEKNPNLQRLSSGNSDERDSWQPTSNKDRDRRSGSGKDNPLLNTQTADYFARSSSSKETTTTTTTTTTAANTVSSKDTKPSLLSGTSAKDMASEAAKKLTSENSKESASVKHEDTPAPSGSQRTAFKAKLEPLIPISSKPAETASSSKPPQLGSLIPIGTRPSVSDKANLGLSVDEEGDDSGILDEEIEGEDDDLEGLRKELGLSSLLGSKKDSKSATKQKKDEKREKGGKNKKDKKDTKEDDDDISLSDDNYDLDFENDDLTDGSLVTDDKSADSDLDSKHFDHIEDAESPR